MELHQLRYLRAVIRAGSITRAAELEHVSQPSISKQIRLMERELGLPLFHRVGRRVLATEAGTLLATCADRIFDDLAATTDALAALRSSQRGYLRLCGTETVVDYILPPLLAELRARRPGVHISVEMLSVDDAVARLLTDEIDAGILPLPLADSRLEIEPLFEEEILFVVPPGHAWALHGQVDLAAALAERDLLLSMPGHGLRAQLEREAHARSIRLQSGMDLRSQHALLSLVACGAGVAFAPLIAVRQHGDGVASLSLRPRLTRQVGAVIRRGRHISPLATELLRQIRLAMREQSEVESRT